MNPKIKIIGKDGKGWSIDNDRFYHEKAVKELGYPIAATAFGADIIFNVWYSYLLKKKCIPLILFKGKRKIINVLTNDPQDNQTDIKRYEAFTDFWVCANLKQKHFLLSQSVTENRIFMNPFYVDEQVFKDLKLSRNELARQLNHTGSDIENKCIIGSFQRDSRGDDLSKSKWHKNPEMMLDILNRLDKTKIILLLAGPRRHFIIRECRKQGIPYLFYGDESFIDKNLDDVSSNTVSYEKINLLYNLSDLCLLTSASEGGPKAVIEASLTKTPVLVTPVGFAPDLLDPQSVCTTTDEFRLKIESMISNPKSVDDLIQKNYENVSKINNFEAYKQRIKHIIDSVSNE